MLFELKRGLHEPGIFAGELPRAGKHFIHKLSPLAAILLYGYHCATGLIFLAYHLHFPFQTYAKLLLYGVDDMLG